MAFPSSLPGWRPSRSRMNATRSSWHEIEPIGNVTEIIHCTFCIIVDQQRRTITWLAL